MIWALLWLGACASRQPFYEPVGFQDAWVDPLDQGYLAEVVEADLQHGRIEGVELLDGDRVQQVPPDGLFELSTPVLYALYLCAGRRARGGEYDLLVHTTRPEDPDPEATELAVPVTVWSSPTGTLRVARGSAPPQPAEPPVHGDRARWKQDLARVFGLLRVEDVDATWSEQELADLETALSLLTEDELLAVEGLVFGRMASSRRMPGRELAYFDPRTQPPRIDVFDLGFHSFDSAFVGPVSSPVRAPVMTLLHEIGHAVADLPLRRAWERFVDRDEAWRTATDPGALGALAESRRDARQEMRQLGLNGPVIEAYREVRGRKRGPTSWAWRQVHESFAEAFALYHLDPQALRRAIPEVHDWFDQGGHVAWLDEAREAPLRARQPR